MNETRWFPFLLLLLAACGGGDSTEPVVLATPEELTEEGWAHYAQGRDVEAAARFAEAIAMDPAFADAYNGRGWANLRRLRFAEALDDFADALAFGLDTADPLAGRALVLRDLEPVQWGAVAETARLALTADSRYIFARDPALDWRDLRILLGQALFADREYEGVNDQIRLLGGTPADPASASFVRDLLAELERLAALSAR